jgi:hypothetical protein
MERRKFVAGSLLAASAFATTGFSNAQVKKKEFYEWREYEMKFGSSQSLLHAYLEKALIPALNKQGIKTVGVFKETSKTDPAKIYVLIPYPSMDQYITINEKIQNDSEYRTNAQPYLQSPPEKPVFNRMRTSMMIAFDGLANLTVPAKGTRLFEFRLYEGYNEDAVSRKVKMFNDAEIAVFYRTKLNPVFFGHMVAGPTVPCIAYMLVFRDMEERDKNWAAFSADADWKKISQDPQYANTVSNIIRVFMEPLAYSQV